jgi:hypothetical protein
VSLLLGVGFVLIALARGVPQADDGVLAWLGYINLTLLVFNLLPALPLDGGRLLRAALWRFKEDFVWATRIGADVGRGFGYLFIAGGIALFVFEGAFSGAWLAFVGWFVLAAATADARYVLAREALSGLRVRDLMTRNPASVPADLTLGRFMDDVVWGRRHTTNPVVDDGRALGLLPFRCVAQSPAASGTSAGCMTACSPGTTFPCCRRTMRRWDALESGSNQALVLLGWQARRRPVDERPGAGPGREAASPRRRARRRPAAHV